MDPSGIGSRGRLRAVWIPFTDDPRTPSVRLRCRDVVERLRARGHAVSVASPGAAEDAPIVVFSKRYSPADRARAERTRVRGGSTILDLCDNHFYNPARLPRYERAARDLAAMLRVVDRVVCSTPALAEVVAAAAPDAAAVARGIRVIGDGVDVGETEKIPAEPPGGRPSLLWFGHHGSPNAPSGMEDLLGIAPHLVEAARIRPFELVVCGNSEEKFDAIRDRLGVAARYVEWNESGFSALLRAARAVVIPISRNPFTRCKSNNRIAVALAHGIPVIADAIPSYEEFRPFAVLDDWPRGLREALVDPAPLRAAAARGREHVRARWSPERLADAWERLLEESRPPRALVVVAHYGARIDLPLRDLLADLAAREAGGDFDVRVVVNGPGEIGVDPAAYPFRVEIVRRENRGMNIGAWDHGWRTAPGYDDFLFLQSECRLRTGGWLRGFRRSARRTGAGMIGEALNHRWDRPWSELLARPDDDGGLAARARSYRASMISWGIDPGATGRHLRSLVWYLRRETLEAIDGFPIGEDYGACIAAEIGVSRKVEAIGRSVRQAGLWPFRYFGHADWRTEYWAFDARREPLRESTPPAMRAGERPVASGGARSGPFDLFAALLRIGRRRG